MKNKTVLYFILATVSLSCSSIESDAEKMAELQCESIRMAMGNAMGSGDLDTKSIEAHGKKVQKFTEKMMKKYDSSEETRKFQALVMEKSTQICRE